MVVTSILARTSDEKAARAVRGKVRGSLAERLGDSKKLVAFEDSALGEAWTRALVLRTGGTATTPAELLRAVALDDDATLRRPCPSHHADMCWAEGQARFVAEDALVAQCARDLERLAARGIHVMRARVIVACTKTLNDAGARGLSRFDVDLHAMERLALAARADAGEDIFALCGKVGGFDFYGDRFGPLAGWLHTVVEEGRANSEYHVAGLGRLAFVRDADDAHMIVGLASLVGKWVRDALMRRILDWYRVAAPDAELPAASGYHDPVTSRFIEATRLVRKERRVSPSCFERVAVGKVARPAPTAPAPDVTSSE